MFCVTEVIAATLTHVGLFAKGLSGWFLNFEWAIEQFILFVSRIFFTIINNKSITEIKDYLWLWFWLLNSTDFLDFIWNRIFLWTQKCWHRTYWYHCLQKHKQELKYPNTEFKLGIPSNVEKNNISGNILSSNTIKVFSSNNIKVFSKKKCY